MPIISRAITLSHEIGFLPLITVKILLNDWAIKAVKTKYYFFNNFIFRNFFSGPYSVLIYLGIDISSGVWSPYKRLTNKLY